MTDSLQENDQSPGYQSWTTEESNELLRLMVDIANRGWRDHSGKINKITVERHILKPLNERLGIMRTYNQYKSREKYFKRLYIKYNTLMRHNSGFGWDPVSKFFTACDEVWADYFKSHPKDIGLRTDPHPDYEDLRIAVGNGTAQGNFSIAIGEATLDGYKVRKIFGRSHFTTSQNFNKVLKALKTYAVDLMAKPGSSVPEKIRESTRFYPYFKDCIGAIDGTHIPAMIIGRDTSSYRNRHGIISQNVLAACNFDLEFIYVLSGWEGSAHDSKILTDALTRRNGLKVQNGKYLLADCGYPNRRQFLAPYRGTRYHLNDFTGQGRNPSNAKELFNLRHSSLRNVVERIIKIVVNGP